VDEELVQCCHQHIGDFDRSNAGKGVADVRTLEEKGRMYLDRDMIMSMLKAQG